jgi:predicted transcriptional regulator
MLRTTITLPEALLGRVDSLAGKRGRSRFIADAVEQRVRREDRIRVARSVAGASVGTPSWRSPDEIIRWANELRDEDRDSWTEHESGGR